MESFLHANKNIKKIVDIWIYKDRICNASFMFFIVQLQS